MKRLACGLMMLAGLVSWAGATPLVPTHDDQVIEVLPAPAADRAEERRLRRDWATNPQDPVRSLALARRYLDQAHTLGDPRYAGRALAVLQRWSDPSHAPDEVLLTQADIEQYLHEFDAAADKLERLTTRSPGHAQAWLTLATVRRVQGRYDASDRACARVAAAGQGLYGRACLAENAGLRGRFDEARSALTLLLRLPRQPESTRGWLLTSLAELEARAGAPAAAESAYRQALAASPGGYTAMSFADFLLFQRRDAEALQVLADQPRTDEVLLRVAIAGTRAGTPQGRVDAREVRDRTALANLRPETQSTHAREAAMVALWLDPQPAEALRLATLNLQHQREPMDVLLLAQVAHDMSQPAGQREAARVRQEMGLEDRRLDALLR